MHIKEFVKKKHVEKNDMNFKICQILTKKHEIYNSQNESYLKKLLMLSPWNFH